MKIHLLKQRCLTQLASFPTVKKDEKRISFFSSLLSRDHCRFLASHPPIYQKKGESGIEGNSSPIALSPLLGSIFIQHLWWHIAIFLSLAGILEECFVFYLREEVASKITLSIHLVIIFSSYNRTESRAL